MNKTTKEIIHDMYVNGYSKEFTFQLVRKIDPDVRRTEVREYEKILDHNPVLFEERKQIQKYTIKETRKNPTYRTMRETGYEYRLLNDPTDEFILSNLYPIKY